MARQPTNDQKTPSAADHADESFVRRWARLKEESRAEGDASGKAPTRTAVPGTPTDDRQSEAKPPAGTKPFDITQLPPLESLTKESDFSLFMRPEVPDELRNKALRRLWALDATLAGPDWLEMYMVDFNDVPTFPDGLKDTLYQVGKGYIDKIDHDDEKSAAVEKTSGTKTTPVTAAGEEPEGTEGSESVERPAPDADSKTKSSG